MDQSVRIKKAIYRMMRLKLKFRFKCTTTTSKRNIMIIVSAEIAFSDKLYMAPYNLRDDLGRSLCMAGSLHDLRENSCTALWSVRRTTCEPPVCALRQCPCNSYKNDIIQMGHLFHLLVLFSTCSFVRSFPRIARISNQPIVFQIPKWNRTSAMSPVTRKPA